MNRLQKKCLIATAGFHLLLVLVIVFGAAFFTSEEKPDETTPVTVIPWKTIDAAFNSGVKNPQPPTPPPKPEVTPPEPPKPVVKEVEPVKPVEPVQPPELVKPVDDPLKHEVKPDLTRVVRDVPKVSDTTKADDAHKSAEDLKRRKAAIAKALASITKNASSATEVEMPGTGSVSYANYASVVKSIYERAWRTPDDASNDDANTKVSVTIGSDGNVISSRILDGSGDAKVDASVQRTLDNVSFVAPFPDGAKEKEKTFIINFNLKAKRMNG